MDVATAFGIVLRRLRIEKKLSQEALAGAAGLQRKYISLLEQATHQPKIATVFELARALEVPPSLLVSMVERELLSRRRSGNRASRTTDP